MSETYNTDEVKELDECRVEEIVLVSVGGERLHHRPEQIKPGDVAIVELILETDTLA